MHNVREIIFLLIKFKFLWKNGISEKIKLIYPCTCQHYNNCSALTLLISFKNFLAPPPFIKEDRDFALYMRVYKGETIKLLTYMIGFLSIEL